MSRNHFLGTGILSACLMVAMAYSGCDSASSSHREEAKAQPEREVAMKWVESARASRDAHDYAKAAEIYEKAAQVLADQGWVKGELADVYRNQGRYEEAIASYQEAFQTMPDSGWIHGGLGLTYKAMGKNEEAIMHLKAALEKEPDDPWNRQALDELLAR